MNKRNDYDAMTAKELEAELREAFFYSDRIDETLSGELERIREALERKRPTEYLYTPEESWERFCRENPEALEALAAGEVKSITLQGKNKSYDVEVSVDGENVKAFAEACQGLG